VDSVARRLLTRGARFIGNCLSKTNGWEDFVLLAGTHAAIDVRRIERLCDLSDAGFRVFSQWDDDGIIEWLVTRLPGIPESFVEFGVEDYLESNTRFLLRHRNWRGLVMDGSEENIKMICGHRMYYQHDLQAVAAFIDRDNINSLLQQHGLAGEIGVLSIDIDGNDYWVWQAIGEVSPWIVIAEYNAVFGNMLPISIPYDASFDRRRAHSSMLYFGASVKALECLGSNSGYTLIGSNHAGNNAFFIRDDLLPRFEGAIADRRPRPSLVREARGPNGALTFVSGSARLELIADMAVTNVETGNSLRLGEAGGLYSAEWLAAMGEPRKVLPKRGMAGGHGRTPQSASDLKHTQLAPPI
jgi:hypothetical protein